jgi:hypothetical protein
MAPVAGKRGVWNRALVVAVMEGHLDVCRYLVEDIRVDVNWLSNEGLILFTSRQFCSSVRIFGSNYWIREEISQLITAFC